MTARGAALREGLRVVLVGPPNVGKSSLLNALAEQDVALVTDIAGTTRDRIVQEIVIEGVPIHVIDTAGLRQTEDRVEQLGIERTWKEIAQSQLVLLMRDASGAIAIDDALEAEVLAKAASRRLVMWWWGKPSISRLMCSRAMAPGRNRAKLWLRPKSTSSVAIERTSI